MTPLLRFRRTEEQFEAGLASLVLVALILRGLRSRSAVDGGTWIQAWGPSARQSHLHSER